MSFGDKSAEFAGKVAELYKEIVTNTAKFEGLERHTTETLLLFRQSLEALAAKVETMHLEHVRNQAEVKSMVQILDGRLSMLSEKALLAVAKEAAIEVVRERMAGGNRPSAALAVDHSDLPTPRS